MLNAQKSHAGVYLCTASNFLGNVSKTITVNVWCKYEYIQWLCVKSIITSERVSDSIHFSLVELYSCSAIVARMIVRTTEFFSIMLNHNSEISKIMPLTSLKLRFYLKSSNIATKLTNHESVVWCSIFKQLFSRLCCGYRNVSHCHGKHCCHDYSHQNDHTSRSKASLLKLSLWKQPLSACIRIRSQFR